MVGYYFTNFKQLPNLPVSLTFWRRFYLWNKKRKLRKGRLASDWRNGAAYPRGLLHLTSLEDSRQYMLITSRLQCAGAPFYWVKKLSSLSKFSRKHDYHCHFDTHWARRVLVVFVNPCTLAPYSLFKYNPARSMAHRIKLAMLPLSSTQAAIDVEKDDSVSHIHFLKLFKCYFHHLLLLCYSNSRQLSDHLVTYVEPRTFMAWHNLYSYTSRIRVFVVVWNVAVMFITILWRNYERERKYNCAIHIAAAAAAVSN